MVLSSPRSGRYRVPVWIVLVQASQALSSAAALAIASEIPSGFAGPQKRTVKAKTPAHPNERLRTVIPVPVAIGECEASATKTTPGRSEINPNKVSKRLAECAKNDGSQWRVLYTDWIAACLAEQSRGRAVVEDSGDQSPLGPPRGAVVLNYCVTGRRTPCRAVDLDRPYDRNRQRVGLPLSS